MHPHGRDRLIDALPSLVAGIALLIGLWLLPDLAPGDTPPIMGQQSLHGRIVASVDAGGTGLPTFDVEVLDGPSAGEIVRAVVQDGSLAVPGSADREPYAVDDEVVVTRPIGPASGSAMITEPWRIPLLAGLAGLFAAAVLVVGGLRGARSLVALALTLGVIIKIVLPLLLRGIDPILLAVAAGSAVTVATLLLTEGWSRVTAAAALGTGVALALTAALAATFSGLARFTLLQGNEEVAFLIPLIGDRVDLTGILLAATVFGALGVLDDVTVTQAAAVEQLHRADPSAPRAVLVARAMRVGRAHIAATVNTLMLAYLGAGLPLLLLFALGGQEPMTVMNSEIVAVEIIRALVGSIGIVAAVPLTTFVAAALGADTRPAANATS
jgi:uncharacterized membrane protein